MIFSLRAKSGEIIQSKSHRTKSQRAKLGVSHLNGLGLL